MRLATALIPHGICAFHLGAVEVVILLAGIGAVVTGLTKHLRIHFVASRHRNHAAHVLSPIRRSPATTDEAGAGRSADGSVGPCPLEADAASGQRIDIRREGVFVAKAAVVRTIVLTGEPEDVWPVSGEDGGGKEKRGEKADHSGQQRTRGEGGSCSDSSGCGSPSKLVKSSLHLPLRASMTLVSFSPHFVKNERRHPRDAAAEDGVKTRTRRITELRLA